MANDKPFDTSHPRILDWRGLTGTDFEQLDMSRCFVMVTCSPFEVHGPHLPVVADLAEAEAIGELTLSRFLDRHEDALVVKLPPVYVATDVVPRRGSLYFRASTVRQVIEDLGRSLAKQGFQHICVWNFHGGPRHFVAVEHACDHVSRKHGVAMVSIFSYVLNLLTGGSTDLSGILSGVEGLTPEVLAGDTHAGAIETSILLHALGEYVSEHGELEPRRMPTAKDPNAPSKRPTLTEQVKNFRTMLTYFHDETYAGDPAAGSAEAGEQILEVLSGHAANALSDLWTGKSSPAEWHSPLWPIRGLLGNEVLRWLAERLSRSNNRVF